MRKKFKNFNEEQIKYLFEILPNYPSWEVSEMFYNKYNILLTRRKIEYYRYQYNVKTTYENPAYFKKGNKVVPTKSMYTERKNNGYTYVKVGNNNWVLKQRYIYEKKYGKIPKGYSIVFLDRNKENFEIDNLMLVPMNVAGIIGGSNIDTNNKEINKTLLMAGLLDYKAKKRMY